MTRAWLVRPCTLRGLGQFGTSSLTEESPLHTELTFSAAVAVFCFETFAQRALWFLLLCWKFCVCGKFPTTFQGLYSVPKRLLEMEMVFFSENDLTDDQKGNMKTVVWGWQGCQCSLYLGSGLLGLRQCLANSPWLSLGIGAGETQEGERGGGY